MKETALIGKGFVYTVSGEETVRAIRIFRNGEYHDVFTVSDDDYAVDILAADEHRDTIIVVLKRKSEEKNDG